MKNMLTMAEVALIVRRPLSTVWRWARTGALPAKRFGRVYLISEQDLERFLENGTQ